MVEVTDLSDGSFSIGGTVWPGLSKLIEECGEVLQIAGKLIATRGESTHWDGDGDLVERLEEELADLLAAIHFVVSWNDLDATEIEERAGMKLSRFCTWQVERMAAS